MAEEAVIARAHPLRSAGRDNPYSRACCGSSRKPWSSSKYPALANILIHDVMRDGSQKHTVVASAFPMVVWASNKPHNQHHLQQFLAVRKDKVKAALEWLHENNPLYNDIFIDYEELDGWSNEFVPSSIIDNIVQCTPDHSEKEGLHHGFRNRKPWRWFPGGGC